MWSAWNEGAKALTQALEKTGDVLSKAATNAGKSARQQHPSTTPAGAASTATGASSGPSQGSKAGSRSPTSTEQLQQQQQQSQSPTAQLQQERANANDDSDDGPQTAVKGRYNDESSTPTLTLAAPDTKELFRNISAGWSTVVQQTKASLKTAQEVVEEQQVRLQERLHKARVDFHKRDLRLPLDVPALKDAEVVYVTDRLISMSHPAMASSVDGEITGERKLAAVGHMLQRRHGGRFMVWNISEVDYDYSILDDQVLTFSFPGSPSPPLGLMLKLLISMEAWMKADDRNVGVVHCLTGKGRTSTVLAAFMCWMGEAGFGDIYKAMEYIALCKQIPVEELTIPSQRRYASYFKNMLDGVRPSQPPLMLKRIIMSEAPRYAKGPPREKKEGENTKELSAEEEKIQSMGCAPYLQVFKAGKLLHTAPASLHFQQSADELPFCQVADGSISFHINQIVQGDVLIRCRHLTAKKQRVSMFRASFHTGYVPPNVMRLNKSQLDGACNDARFPDDFFLDLIFEQINAEDASRMLQEGEQKAEGTNKNLSQDETGDSEKTPDLVSSPSTVTASAYDTMLHRDSRFWDVIAARRQESSQTDGVPQDPLWGPTIGRRRTFGEGSPRKRDGESSDKKAPAAASSAAKERSSFETFSIGGEFDFLPETNDDKPVAPVTTTAKPLAKPVTSERKKDSLMEALMALDTDTPEEYEQEIVFEESQPAAVAPARPAEPQATVVALPPLNSPSTPDTQAAPSASDASSSTANAATATADSVNQVSTEATSNTEASNESSNTKVLTKQESLAASSKASTTDVEALLRDTDVDMDALLGEDGGTGEYTDNPDMSEFDDSELEDLEKFLTK